jgi:hypothetical protein
MLMVLLIMKTTALINQTVRVLALAYLLQINLVSIVSVVGIASSAAPPMVSAAKTRRIQTEMELEMCVRKTWMEMG